ncbi:MAG: dienelactone hydrolase family protein [Motiliproteus sp.]
MTKHLKHLQHPTMITTLILILILASSNSLGALLTKSYKKVTISNRYVHQSDSLNGWFYSPTGPGPYPSIVLLHGCAGVTDNHHNWAEKLVSWGYAALIVDSFSPRSLNSLCRAGDELWTTFNQLRPADARAALDYLASEPLADAGRVGLMGWSYGATMTLRTLRASRQGADDSPAFKAGIAFYPSCWQYRKYLQGPDAYASSAPLYILQGAEDNWTLPAHCQTFVDRAEQTPNPITLRLYAGAYHGFDDNRQLTTRVWGVRLESDQQPWGNVIIGYNKNAHRKAEQELEAILDRYLSIK